MAEADTSGLRVEVERARRHFGEGRLARLCRAKGPKAPLETGTLALDGVDLTIGSGEFVSLLGPSGCGKSTLLRLVAGLDRPTAGSVRVDSGAIAFVFQEAHLLPWRDVLGNVALPLELGGVGAERVARAEAALTLVGLSDFARSMPHQLSGGMRMRVSLARAMVVEPRLLLLDEPFAALDELTRQRLDDELRRLWRARRMTVLFVTHSVDEAAYLAERAVVFTPRPARVVLDAALELPIERSAALRAEATFQAQAQRLRAALEAGAEPPAARAGSEGAQ